MGQSLLININHQIKIGSTHEKITIMKSLINPLIHRKIRRKIPWVELDKSGVRPSAVNRNVAPSEAFGFLRGSEKWQLFIA